VGDALAADLDVRRQAAAAVTLVQSDPRRARAAAAAARDRAEREGDAAALSTAERALGLAARELKEVDAAVAHLRLAVHVADESALSQLAAEARMSLSLALAYAGDTAAALQEADAAAAVLRGREAAHVQMQRALILQRLGREDEALAGYRRALAAFRRAHDPVWEARLLNNRGILNVYRGAWRAGEADLLRAEQLEADLGQDYERACTQHNLGFAAARRGDVPLALEWYDRADAYFREQGAPRAESLADRCELLLGVRLVREARRAAEQAVAELERGGVASDLAEARLNLAEAALLDGDFELARAEAARARAAFSRQRRPSWAALARHVALRGAWLAGDRSAATLTAARRTADALAESRWLVPALEARLIAGQIALAAGRPDAARRELAKAAAARHRGPVALRVAAWHAHALLRLAEGDRRGAAAAVRAGLRLLEHYRASLGATELRAHASGHGEGLAELGLRLALESHDPRRLLDSAERWRAGTLALRPVRPPDDRLLARELAELRGLSADVEAATLAGLNPVALLRRQAALESSIRRRSRRSRGGLHDDHGAPRPSVAELSARLGARALVEFVAHRDELWAVVVVDGGATLHHLGPLEPVLREAEWLRIGLERLSHAGESPAAQTALEAAERAAGRLDESLLSPVRRLLGDRALVLVPTAALHALPWAALPSLAGRPVAIAPSAAAWHAREPRPPTAADRVVLAAGPDVPGATREVDALALLYPSAQRLDGERATALAVLEALDGAVLAHVVAHGSFRADNPLFSSLRLADGPITVYDLEALQRAPSTLVLSACESGLSAVRPGDELMGLASALFASGTDVLVASVVSVPDATARPLMAAFHAGLAAGTGHAEALADAQVAVAGAGYAGRAAAAGFLCLGGG
jgi:Tfp pilus assembly protein PilF